MALYSTTMLIFGLLEANQPGSHSAFPNQASVSLWGATPPPNPSMWLIELTQVSATVWARGRGLGK